MKTNLEFKLEYEKKGTNALYPVIIVAAGSASRMKGIDKLSSKLDGVPVLARTISAFDKCNLVSRIVVVTRKDKIDEYLSYKNEFGFTKDYSVVEGGASREESVLNGIKSLSSEFSKVLIHDGARPLVSEDVISRVCDALSFNNSVSCGVKVKDTIKVINEDMIVSKTLDRNMLTSIQTPQGVSVDMFLKSASVNDISKFTDDTSVVEAVGAKTQIVEGDYKNIKITTPEDIQLARLYLKD